MSGILKRTMFIAVDRRKAREKFRPVDWASVVTGIGQCAEPFKWMERLDPGGQYPAPNSDDMMNRVDEVRFIDDSQGVSLFGDAQGSGTALTGGYIDGMGGQPGA